MLDGGDALTELQADAFDILILDVMLPSVGGFDVLGNAVHYSPPGAPIDIAV